MIPLGISNRQLRFDGYAASSSRTAWSSVSCGTPCFFKTSSSRTWALKANCASSRRKPTVHAQFCRAVAGRGICATGRCTIALGSQQPDHHQVQQRKQGNYSHEALEAISGNDNSPNSAKEQLNQAFGGHQSAQQLAEWCEANPGDFSELMSMPSFKAFFDRFQVVTTAMRCPKDKK